MSIIRRSLSYVQGQYREKIREYFYFIDHQGMVNRFFSNRDSYSWMMFELKTSHLASRVIEYNQKFLHFFFTRVKANDSGFYENEFPYVSPCGRELNYIRCDDLPIVFTKINQATRELVWAHVNDLKVHFEPEKIYMSREGRIYHPYSKYPYVGLIPSKVGIEISNNFSFVNNYPRQFKWDGQTYDLTNECEALLKKYRLHSVRDY